MTSVSSSASSVDISNKNMKIYSDKEYRTSEVKEKSKRPQLSCRNCRQRKVKCDRIQPCTACSLHQSAEECTYDLSEQERQPILQAEALRAKDKEIDRLKNELASRSHGHYLPETTSMLGSKQRRSPHEHTLRALTAAQIQPYEGGYDDQDMMMSQSISVTQELADMSLRHKTHAGRYQDYSSYRLRISTANSYPFPTLWAADEGIAALYRHIPQRNELLTYLDSFEKRAVGTAFPYIPKYCSRRNVEKFVVQLEQNAESRPDVLALLFAAMAQGVFYGAFDRLDGRPSQGAMLQEIGKSNFFMAVAFQALRISAFLSRPSLCTIETLTMLSQCLCDTGRFVDAWVLIGITIRLAVLAKFHRNPISADMEANQEEQSHKAALWWWLLSLDATSSMVCGRPLGASTPGDCHPVDIITEHSPANALAGIRHQVTVLCRTILEQRRFTGGSISSMTEQLLGILHSSAAFVPPNFGWLDVTAPLPPWPLDGQLASLHIMVHTLIILVNQQRQTLRQDLSDPDVSMSYNTVLESARVILRIFRFVKQRIPPALQNWTLCQAAFNAAILLTRGLALHFDPIDAELVGEAHNNFQALHQTGVHNLAASAATRINHLFRDVREGKCQAPEVLCKDGMALIEGSDLQDTLLTGYEFASGDSDMSSPLEERSSPLVQHSLQHAAPLQQQQQQQPPPPQSRDKASKKTRPSQPTASVPSVRSSSKRAPRKEKETTKTRSSHGWSTNDSHAASQGNRQWSVSKKQHHHQTLSRLGQAPQKPRSRGTGAAASQYISTHASQYLPNDVLNSFPNPPSTSMAADAASGWDELASQMMAGAGQPGQMQMHGNVPVTMVSQTGHPTTAGVVQGDKQQQQQNAGQQTSQQQQQQSQAAQQQQQQQQQAATMAAQHAFTSNSHTYSQPQSPALWGFAFNPLTEQGLGQAQDEAGAQGVSQEQQILFPGGVTDPRFFWDLNDETPGTQYFWGG